MSVIFIVVCLDQMEKGSFSVWPICCQPFTEQARWIFCFTASSFLCIWPWFSSHPRCRASRAPHAAPGTHKDAQTEHGDSWSLAQGQQQEQQGRAQLHQVEKVVVCKEVGSECFGIFGVSEELVIIFSFLGQQE